MQKFTVNGMTCDHCVRAITQAVQALDSAAKVEVDLAQGEVRVDSALGAPAILAAIREEGYEAESAAGQASSGHGSCCGKCGG